MILALADDLTGALEVGAKFSARGFQARVSTKESGLAGTRDEVLVIDTESRHLDAKDAYDEVFRVAMEAARHPWDLIFKKTDSTLRGNVAAELEALQSAFPKRITIYAPTYPELGRTVVEGKLYVWGRLLHETEFACDLLNPVRESDIRKLLNGVPATVLDGACAEDLRRAARMILEPGKPTIAAGTAALAGALAEVMRPNSQVRRPLPRLNRCLLVNGSMHPSSHQQVAFGVTEGCFDHQWCHFQEIVDGDGLERAKQIGFAVRRRLQESPFDGLIVFGGDTAYGIYAALNSPTLEPLGELFPGIPVSRAGDLTLITKAGGFGSPDLIVQMKRLLT